MSSYIGKNQCHVGKLILEEFGKNCEIVCVVDARTGQTETKKSVLKRSIALAKSMRRMGIKPNDVIALGGRNHIDIRIPYYAGLLIGCPFAGVYPLYKLDELKEIFSVIKPKLAFCQLDRFDDNVAAAKELGLDTRVVTFEDGEHSFKRFLEEFNGYDDEEFHVTEFDPASTYAWLVATSGSTGVPKVAAFLHEAVAKSYANAFPTPEKMTGKGWLNTSPISWVSAIVIGLLVPLKDGFILQTSAEATPDHIIDMINTYKPAGGIMNPMNASLILRSPKHCDFNSFECLILGASKVHYQIIEEIRNKNENAGVLEVYTQTEMMMQVFQFSTHEPRGSMGKKQPHVIMKLVDLVTQEEVTEPNKPGELWVKDVKFHCYYNMPEETKLAFSPDGYYKTGDVLKYDEEGHYYFLDRVKSLIYYRGTYILPNEIEEVLVGHPAVSRVVVTGLPEDEAGALPVACVVLHPSHTLTAAHIHEIIRDNLSENKQLHGGVVFLDELPLTSTGKVALAKLNQIVMNAKRE